MKNLQLIKRIFNFQFPIFNSQKGFTLLELIIYMGMLSIILIVLTDVFVSILSVQTESDATSAVEQDGRYILTRLNYDIQRAESIILPVSVGDSGNSLSMLIDGDQYTYSISGGNLQLTINTDPPMNLNGNESTITSINFQRIANTAPVVNSKDTIKLQFTIDSITERQGGVETRTFYTTVGRRDDVPSP